MHPQSSQEIYPALVLDVIHLQLLFTETISEYESQRSDPPLEEISLPQPFNLYHIFLL